MSYDKRTLKIRFNELGYIWRLYFGFKNTAYPWEIELPKYKKQYRGIDTEYQRINTTTAMTVKENNNKNS